jgi:hypothetical protein
MKLFSGAGVELDPPDLCLLSSWDDKREPLASSIIFLKRIFQQTR